MLVVVSTEFPTVAIKIGTAGSDLGNLSLKTILRQSSSLEFVLSEQSYPSIME